MDSVNNRNQHCTNCGLIGHVFRNCLSPVTSYGIIAVRYMNNNVSNSLFSKATTISNGSDSIQFLLIQRKDSLAFVEFIRGKYDTSNLEYIVKLFNMMTFDEKRLLRQYDSFDMIRTLIGLKREYNYRNEYDESKKKFNMLKNHQLGDQVNLLLDKSYTKWTSPEWGVPKGRRNNKELDIECAIREFVEETGIQYKNINVYRNIKPVEEIYTGINGVVYKHIYFIADIKSTTDAIENMLQVEKGGHLNHEIGNIKLFNLTEAHKLIRPYYMSKLNAIKKGFEIIRDINSYFE